jgi:hypothetical protein
MQRNMVGEVDGAVLSGATAQDRALLMCIERLDALEARHEAQEARHKRTRAALLMLTGESTSVIYAELAAFLFGLTTSDWIDILSVDYYRATPSERKQVLLFTLRNVLANHQVPARAAAVHRACMAHAGTAFAPVWEAEWDAVKAAAFSEELDVQSMLDELTAPELDAFWQWHLVWTRWRRVKK